MAYHIRFSAVSHVGLRRKENQDNFVCNGRVMDKGKGVIYTYSVPAPTKWIGR